MKTILKGYLKSSEVEYTDIANKIDFSNLFIVSLHGRNIDG